MTESKIIPYTSVQNIASGPALVLAPHPDDEVLGCGGAILRHVASGDKVQVVIMTDGSAASGASNFKGNYIKMRQNEALSAAEFLGCEPPHFLNKPDRSLRYGEPLINEVLQLINERKPNVVYSPSIYEIHPDHRALALSTLEAVRRQGGDLLIAQYEIGNPQMPNILLDISDIVDDLKQAMACYRSQLEERPYDRFVFDGLNQFRAYTLDASVSAAEGYWVASGSDLRKRHTSLFGMLAQSWADAGIDVNEQSKSEIPKYSVTPLVSVITRTIGRSSLSQSIMSVAKQVWPNIELILVEADPESPFLADGCDFPNVNIKRYTSDRSLSRSEAANTGLQRALGEFVIFLDDDDTIDPEHISGLATALIDNPSAIAAYAGVRVRRSRAPGAANVEIYHHPFDARRLAYGNFLPIHGVLFRRNVVEKGCQFDQRLDFFEDWDFWLQLSKVAPFIRVEQVSATYYSVGGSGVGPLNFDRTALETARVDIYRKWIHLWGPEDIDHIFSLYRTTRARVLALENEKKKLNQDLHRARIRVRELVKLSEPSKHAPTKNSLISTVSGKVDTIDK